jgi:hypothetical protein
MGSNRIHIDRAVCAVVVTTAPFAGDQG